jgi:ZIP family zinc transporter
MPWLLGGITVFAAGGVLYPRLQDIAPRASLERHWVPLLGAGGGFMRGLLGHILGT